MRIPLVDQPSPEETRRVVRAELVALRERRLQEIAKLQLEVARIDALLRDMAREEQGA